MNQLGDFLKERRKERAMTQQEFADKIGVTVQTLSRLENGGVCGSVVLRKLSNFTNVSTKLLRRMMLIDES